MKSRSAWLVVIENFNDRTVEVGLSVEGIERYEPVVTLGGGAEMDVTTGGAGASLTLPARSLVALRLR